MKSIVIGLLLLALLPTFCSALEPEGYTEAKAKAKARAQATLSLHALDVKIHQAAPVLWRTDYLAAQREAKAAGKPLLIDFRTTPCPYCEKLEQGTLKDGAVVKALAGYVCVRVEASQYPDLVRGFRVGYFPTLIQADADGTPRKTTTGFVDPQTLLRSLLAPAPPTLKTSHAGPSKAGCACAYGGPCFCGESCGCWPVIVCR